MVLKSKNLKKDFLLNIIFYTIVLFLRLFSPYVTQPTEENILMVWEFDGILQQLSLLK